MISTEWLDNNNWYLFVTIIPMIILTIAVAVAQGAKPEWAVLCAINPLSGIMYFLTAVGPLIVFGLVLVIVSLFLMAHLISKHYGGQQ